MTVHSLQFSNFVKFTLKTVKNCSPSLQDVEKFVSFSVFELYFENFDYGREVYHFVDLIRGMRKLAEIQCFSFAWLIVIYFLSCVLQYGRIPQEEDDVLDLQSLKFETNNGNIIVPYTKYLLNDIISDLGMAVF